MNISPIVAARNTARPFGALSFWQSLYIPNETNGPAIAIENVFAPAEVDKIFLNFSDPWPKARHAKRRLTSTEFLARYEKVLVESGRVEFKTDNTELFNFSLEQVKEAGWALIAYTYDLHHQEEMNEGNIMTEYEQKFSEKGNPINKLIAQRK